MHSTITLITLLATFVAAQDVSELPTCAQACFTDNVDTSACADTTDFACLCGDSAYNQAVLTCVIGACESADQLATLTWATDTCEALGVSLQI
ncbi:CFEM domain-containing protein [Pseudomassariella vexata]|uniref:CFEM domain-containing protein n=1 Tax=Pseudomassariella vexata TaxID=1141098 RepID=A0A1Y2E8L5_9PEZI|nr:CFEM domain-containing protein [Pseudomassariella vexata]ORY67205.1 CFEM domain-containing protein [Pseudomassariella vexata]